MHVIGILLFGLIAIGGIAKFIAYCFEGSKGDKADHYAGPGGP